MDKTTAIWPQLKHNSVFLEYKEGVLIQNEDKKFLIRGKSIARWISVLSPYLTGAYTLEQLCQRVGPDRRAQVASLLTMLLEKGLLKNALPEPPDVLSQAVSHQFHAQIAYIDHFVDQPHKRFRDFRQSSILLTGSGESLRALALSLLRNGIEKLFLAPSDGAEAYAPSLEAEADVLRRNGCPIDISIQAHASQSAIENLDDYDVVVYCTDGGSLQEIAALQKRCFIAGRAFLASTIVAGYAMLGPYVQPPSGPCWYCAQLRFSTNSDDQSAASLWRSIALGSTPYEPDAALFDPQARRIGNGLAYELFKILSGALPSETQNGVIFQHLDTLETFQSPLLQHPLCPVCTQVDHDTSLHQLQETIAGQHDSALTLAEAYEQHQSLFDKRVGLFQGFTDKTLEQVPLKQSQITLNSPDLSRASQKIDITCFSMKTIHEARIATFTRAIESYARSVPDTRTMLFATPQALSTSEKIALSPQVFSHWSGGASLAPQKPIFWLPAYSFLQKTVVSLPAAAVYTSSLLNKHMLFERTTAGWAVDTSYRATLTKGLLSALTYSALRKLLKGEGSLRSISIDPLADAYLAFLLQSAERFARPFTAFMVTYSGPVSIILVRTTDTSSQPVVALGFHLSAQEALKAALLDFVGRLQTLQSGGTLPASMSTFFPGALPFHDLNVVEESAPLADTHATIEAVEDDLQATGRDLLFVETTPADIRAAKTLVSGVVLLAERQSGGLAW